MNELFDAITNGDSGRAAELLAKSGNTSAILLALYHGRADVAKLLVERGAELTFPEACAVGATARVRALLERDRSLVNAFSDDGFPALGLAIYFRQAEVARELIERGADVNAVARNAQKVAPIHGAASIGNRDMVHLLLEHGADPNLRQQQGFVALHAAGLHGDIEMGKDLVEHGADPSAATDDGKKAEDFAREKGHEHFVRWLRSPA